MKNQKNRNTIIAIIALGAFISSLNQTVMTVSLPKVMIDFHIQAGIGQWLTTIYMLFLGIMIPLTGFLMNRYSTRKLYIVSIALFFAGCLLAGFAPNFMVLLIARVIQACGAGILLPMPQVVTFRLYEPEKRGAVMGIVGLTTGFAPALGPTIAGWIADMAGWRTIFYLLTALAFISIILSLIKLEDEKMETGGHLDVQSILYSSIGFTGVLTGVTNEGNYGLTSVFTFIPFILGICCIVLFVRRQLHLDEPLLELHVFQNKNFTFGVVLLIFAYGSMLSVSTLLSLYIQGSRGLSAAMSGLVMFPGALLLAFLNPVTGKILDAKGPFLLTVSGLLCLGIGTLALSFSGTNTSMFYIGLGYGIRMLGIVALLQPLMTWAVNAVDDKYVSHSTAIMNTLRQVGGAVVSVVFITIMSTVAATHNDLKGIQVSMLTTSILVFICIIPVFLFMRNKKEERIPQVQINNRNQIITISREFGSGGHRIAEKVAEKLQYAFYDNELIDLAVKESGYSREYIKAHDEIIPHNSKISEYMINNYETKEGGLYKNEQSPLEILFGIQKKIIQELTEKNPSVIVGHCANYVLKDYKNTLHVYLHADKDFRCREAVEEYHIDKDKVIKITEEKDMERSEHYRIFAGGHWRDADNYDLVLNTEKLGIDKCADIIVSTVYEMNSAMDTVKVN